MKPLPVTALGVSLPHRPPMIWIDEVIAADATSGVCTVHLNKDAHYMDEGQLRSSSLVEWMAQAYGYICAYQISAGIGPKRQAPKLTFLAQIRNAEFLNDFPTTGTLHICMAKVRELGPLTLARGKVQTPEGKVLATAELKLYAE